MASSNTFTFNGKAGGYFLVFLVTMIFTYIPFFGWAFVLNYTAGWVVNNLTVNGKQLNYSATFGEALKFIFINTLLVIITFGIYIFWYTPKMYRFVVAHSDFGGAAPSTPAKPAPAPTTPEPAAAKPADSKPPASKNLVQ